MQNNVYKLNVRNPVYDSLPAGYSSILFVFFIIFSAAIFFNFVINKRAINSLLYNIHNFQCRIMYKIIANNNLNFNTLPSQ